MLLDRWEGFTATLGELEAGGLTEILTRLLTEGASVGMHLVMTGDRSLLLGRISSLCEEKLIFKLAEKDDYRLRRPQPARPARRRAARTGLPGRLRHRAAGGAARARRIRARAGCRAAGHRGVLPATR